MNTSKLLLLFEYLCSTKKVNLINKKLIKQFLKEDALELSLWTHITKSSKLTYNKELRLNKDYIAENLFDNDKKSLHRTASRLYKRIRKILIHDFIKTKPFIQDWLYREALKESPNHLLQLMSENIITNKYDTKTTFEKDLNSYIQFHVTYEKYLGDSLQNFADTSLFVKARQDLENYYVKYHSILETERLQREKLKTNENINTLKKPSLNKNQSLLESELLLQKVNSLNEKPQYFDFCFNWFTHLVEEELITEKMQKTIFPVLYNFSLRNYTKSGKLLQQEKLNEIIYLALDKKVLYTKGKLSAFIYVAFLGAIRLEGIEMKKYINKYIEDVPPKEYAKANYISNLYLAFYSNDFESVLDLINKNEENVTLGLDTSFKSKIKLFLIRTYFELGDKRNFMKQYLSAKRYYKSQNLPKEKEDALINAIEYMRHLLYIDSTDSLLGLEKKIFPENLAVKSWLLQKIKESPFYPKG